MTWIVFMENRVIPCNTFNDFSRGDVIHPLLCNVGWGRD